MNFPEAVRLLANENPSYIPPELPKQEPKPFVLPEKMEASMESGATFADGESARMRFVTVCSLALFMRAALITMRCLWGQMKMEQAGMPFCEEFMTGRGNLLRWNRLEVRKNTGFAFLLQKKHIVSLFTKPALTHWHIFPWRGGRINTGYL